MTERREPAAGAAPASAVLEWRGFRLSDFQRRAVEAVRAGHNVLVAAPTGAGKTLVAEYAIEDAVRAGRRSVYTSPIKALSNQKYRDFKRDPALDVGLVTGDVTLNPGARVRVMTTEILRNAILDDPAQLEDVAFVVFDEVHFLDDPERGTVWEEALIFAPPTVRFVCLSATVSNVDELGAWMAEVRSQDLVVVSSDRRPVPLSHRLVVPGGRILDLEQAERARAKHGRGPRRRRGRPAPARGPEATLEGLLDHLQEQALLPALVFSFSRKDCERRARANRRRSLLDAGEVAAMERLLDELVRLFQLEGASAHDELFAMARRGLAYHHAGMLPIHKELVERMFTSGLLKLLFTTETFALGINMPARSVVFQSLRKFDGVSVGYMRTRDYLQMAGRAGRQGIDRDGLVFSVLDERDLDEAPLTRLLTGVPEPVESRFRLSYSSILHLIESLGRERLFEAWEKSLSAFQQRDESDKQRRRARGRVERALEAHLALLLQHAFLEQEGAAFHLTPKGHLARAINGYELQVAELCYRGALEGLPAEAVACVFVAIVFEDRRRWRGPPGQPGYPSARRAPFAGVQRHVTTLLARLAKSEAELGIATPMKPCDWGLSEAVVAWCGGGTMEDLEAMTDVTPGDICRTFRMALQLVRSARAALDPAWDLRETLSVVRASMDRDEIDARRQLELG
jgi:superfamily II RNA helicase